MNIEIQLPAEADPLLISSILVNPRQRRLLGALQDESTPLTERDLAVRLAAQEEGTAPSEVTERERRHQQVTLHHQDLPKLEQAGLIERHVQGIVATDQLSLGDPEWTLPHGEDPDIPSWEVLGALVARPRRQRIVSLLAEQRHPLALEDLAVALARAQRSRTTEVSGDGPGLPATLHHIDLPKLDEVGLIEYDPDDKTIFVEPALPSLVGQTDTDTTENSDAVS